MHFIGNPPLNRCGAMICACTGACMQSVPQWWVNRIPETVRAWDGAKPGEPPVDPKAQVSDAIQSDG